MKPTKKKDDTDYYVKVIVIGDSGVGKTNILVRGCENKFLPNYAETIGVDFKIKPVQIEGKKMKLQLWDTAGQQRYKNINQTFYKGAIGIILVYSINDLTSFSNVQNWIKQIHQYASSNVVKFLVANKCDLISERKIDKQTGLKLANNYDMKFIQVSAKEGTKIQDLFKQLGLVIYEQIKGQQDSKQMNRISLNVGDKKDNSQNQCKC